MQTTTQNREASRRAAEETDRFAEILLNGLRLVASVCCCLGAIGLCLSGQFAPAALLSACSFCVWAL